MKELFYSTPARRKFLKTDATELAHCIDAVRRHALVRPGVGFSIWHEGKLVEQWRKCEGVTALDQRLTDVLGSDFVERSVSIDYRSSNSRQPGAPMVRVWGRAGIPDAARSRADQQSCYVNGRYVRDKVLTHAVRSAYEDVLHGHRQPVYALYIEIDPTRVDVNVHPTKIEVRFRDSREVHQALRHAVDRGVKGIVVQALGMGNMNEAMFEAVKYALSKNIPVVVTTRVHNGRVLPSYGFAGGGKTTFDAGAVMADDLKAPKARILLMLLLQSGVKDKVDLQAAFDR